MKHLSTMDGLVRKSDQGWVVCTLLTEAEQIIQKPTAGDNLLLQTWPRL